MNTKETAGAAVSAPKQIVEIPIEQILPDPRNRKHHNAAKLTALAESIEREGLLQPIVVRPTGKTEKVPNGDKYIEFMIIAGERRWHAHKLLKRATVPCIVHALTEKVQDTRARVAENLKREDLTPIEEAEAYRQLIEDGMSQSEVAAFVGISQPAVANQIRLLALPPSVRKMIHEGTLTRAHGVALARFASRPEAVTVMAERAVADEYRAKDLEGDELPFSWQLKDRKLIVCLYKWEGAKWTKEMAEDPDWQKINDTYVCWNYKKGETERARQDDANRKAEVKKADGAKASGMSAKEKAERAKKIATNRANREASQATMDNAMAHLGQMKTIEKPVLAVVCAKVLTRDRYRSRIKAAAERLGIVIPKGAVVSSCFTDVRPEKLMGLSETDLVRLAAACVVLEEGETGVKYSNPPDVELTMIAGKTKAPAKIEKLKPAAPAKAKKGAKAA